MRDAEYLMTERTEVDVPSAEDTPDLVVPCRLEGLLAMRADGVDIVFTLKFHVSPRLTSLMSRRSAYRARRQSDSVMSSPSLFHNSCSLQRITIRSCLIPLMSLT